MSDHPSRSLLAGQLGYLFEDRPELRRATPETLAARLNQEDRWARARSRYPVETDDEVRSHLDEFDERITVADVEAALAQLAGDGD